jgi:hypothetical protein
MLRIEAERHYRPGRTPVVMVPICSYWRRHELIQGADGPAPSEALTIAVQANRRSILRQVSGARTALGTQNSVNLRSRGFDPASGRNYSAGVQGRDLHADERRDCRIAAQCREIVRCGELRAIA